MIDISKETARIRALIGDDGPVLLSRALAHKVATDSAERAAGVYVLCIAGPDMSAREAVSRSADVVVPWIRDLVADLLRQAGWNEGMAVEAGEVAVDGFCDRVDTLLAASPTNAGGRA